MFSGRHGKWGRLGGEVANECEGARVVKREVGRWVGCLHKIRDLPCDWNTFKYDRVKFTRFGRLLKTADSA
jgi:hypothetical protein